jgi:hypothetical protein
MFFKSQGEAKEIRLVGFRIKHYYSLGKLGPLSPKKKKKQSGLINEALMCRTYYEFGVSRHIRL